MLNYIILSQKDYEKKSFRKSILDYSIKKQNRLNILKLTQKRAHLNYTEVGLDKSCLLH